MHFNCRKVKLSFSFWEKAWANCIQPFKFPDPFVLIIKTGKPYYKNYIDGSFIRENDWPCLCKRLKIPGAVGLAACIVGVTRYVGITE